MAKRVTSVQYLASFVARASFLTTAFALKTVRYMSSFARELLQAAEEHVAVGALSHPQLVLFLSVTQGVCYIICFRAASFAEEVEANGQNALNSLLPVSGAGAVAEDAFTLVLESSVKPMGRISEGVANRFWKVLRPFFPSLGDMPGRPTQETVKLPEIYYQESDSSGRITDVFPFEPYRLRHSHIFVRGAYQTWAAATGDAQTDDSDTEDSAGPKGFQGAIETRGRLNSAKSHRSSTDEPEEEAHSDADFTDVADAADRGFVPSVGPSPMFGARNDEMADISPLCVSMESGLDGGDTFTLPQPRVSLGSGNALLEQMLRSSAYTGSRC